MRDFRLADEIEYIQRCAAERDARFVSVGPVALFSTETGDAWILDPTEHTAARIARDGVPETLNFQETDSNFTIEWSGNYEVEGEDFVFFDRSSPRAVRIAGFLGEQHGPLS